MPDRPPVILCELLPQTQSKIREYSEALKREAPRLGTHGLTEQEFWDSGLFHSAVERLRGIQAASMTEKRTFMAAVLNHMKAARLIRDWAFTGAGERHDYQIELLNGRKSIVECKGCLDGNNTNIFERPRQADEFIIWSLCKNPAADPRRNAWSGIHTRLGPEMIHRGQKIDGVVIWDMVCGTAGRPCPKLTANPGRATTVTLKGIERTVPPPCLYLFPRTIPDPRNNPNPPCLKLAEVGLFRALYQAFRCDANDLVEVRIEARMSGTDVQRRTILVRNGNEIVVSAWTAIARATR